MTNEKYIQTKIREVVDPSFQSMIDALCHCVNLGRDQFEDRVLSYLLMVIGKEKKPLMRQYLAVDGILTTKVGELSPNSIVYQVCRELVNQKGTHIESFDGKTVLSLIKECHKVFCPQFPAPKRLTKRQRSYQFTTQLIKQRRRNGDL